MVETKLIIPKDDGAKANSSVLRLSPYIQGQSKLDGVAKPIKLSSNENSMGPSPQAMQAYVDVGERLYRYPDGTQCALRHAIAGRFDLNPNNIVCGNGSEELHLLLIRAFVSEGDDVIISEYSFVMSKVHSIAQGANIIEAPEPDNRPTAKSILCCITPKTKMIVLASPNNPVGDYMRADDLREVIAAIPPNVILLYDGAYGDYVTKDDYDHGFGWVATHPNVVVTRTFSKLYALAGLRIGWMYCHEDIMDPVQRIRTPFNSNIAALACAEAAIKDTAYARIVQNSNNRWLARIKETLGQLGLHVLPTVSNFYMIRFDEKGSHTAAKAAAYLQSKGIIPRPVNTGGPAGCLRITVGQDHENEAVLKALHDFMTNN